MTLSISAPSSTAWNKLPIVPAKTIKPVRAVKAPAPAKARAIAASEPASPKKRSGRTKKPLAPERIAAILDGLQKAIDLNSIIGSKTIVMASPGRITGIDSWKSVAERLTQAHEKLKPLGMRAGYHNHGPEFTPVDGKRPLEIIAGNTPKDLMLQLDVGTCVASGSDPVAWIKANPGRIKSMHCKDWGPGGEDKGYKVLFGEGASPWKQIFQAAEKSGGIEYYLIEQEGSRFTPFETAQKCLLAYKEMRGIRRGKP